MRGVIDRDQGRPAVAWILQRKTGGRTEQEDESGIREDLETELSDAYLDILLHKKYPSD